MENELTNDGVSKLRKTYDIYRWLWLHNFKLLSKIIWKMAYVVFSSSIPPTTDLGKGVNFGHTMGIVIHQNTKVGDGTMIYQNVTIGRRNGSLNEAPQIGKNCIIGTGACILGNIKIGNNVKVGANTVVTTDIPDNCTVVGVKGRVIKHEK